MFFSTKVAEWVGNSNWKLKFALAHLYTQRGVNEIISWNFVHRVFVLFEIVQTPTKFFSWQFSLKYFKALWNYLLERDTLKDTLHKISAINSGFLYYHPFILASYF